MREQVSIHDDEEIARRKARMLNVGRQGNVVFWVKELRNGTFMIERIEVLRESVQTSTIWQGIG